MQTTTAADLGKMTPAERDAHYEASLVTDLDQASRRAKALLERARQRHRERFSATDA